MRWRTLSFLFWVSSLLIVLLATVLASLGGSHSVSSTMGGRLSALFGQTGNPSQPLEQLRQVAELITVKILSGEVLGSGIIVHKKGAVYVVLTNAHVLRAASPPYQIQTQDGKIYPAEMSQVVSFKDNDLALLEFYSSKAIYQVADLDTSLTKGEEVFAAGFPFSAEQSYTPVFSPTDIDDRGFAIRRGEVSLILNKALKGGYQIGYTSRVEKGMSGGPLLNHLGKVIAVNGMHAEPLWGDPYEFMDGSLPESALKEQLSQYSWGIPITTFQKLAIPTLQAKHSQSEGRGIR